MNFVKSKCNLISKYGLDSEDLKKLIQHMVNNEFNTIEKIYTDTYDLGLYKAFYRIDNYEELGKEIIRNNNNFLELKNGMVVELSHISNKISSEYLNKVFGGKKMSLFKKKESFVATVPAKHTYKVIGISGTGDICQTTVEASNPDKAREEVMKGRHFTEARGYLRDDERDYSLSFKGIISVVRV